MESVHETWPPSLRRILSHPWGTYDGAKTCVRRCLIQAFVSDGRFRARHGWPFPLFFVQLSFLTMGHNLQYSTPVMSHAPDVEKKLNLLFLPLLTWLSRPLLVSRFVRRIYHCRHRFQQQDISPLFGTVEPIWQSWDKVKVTIRAMNRRTEGASRAQMYSKRPTSSSMSSSSSGSPGRMILHKNRPGQYQKQ